MKSVFFNSRASVIFDRQLDIFKNHIEYEDTAIFRNKIFRDSLRILKENEKNSIMYTLSCIKIGK